MFFVHNEKDSNTLITIELFTYSNKLRHSTNNLYILLCTYYNIWPIKYINTPVNLFVCFVALRPKSTAMVIAGLSVHLTTLFPGQAGTGTGSNSRPLDLQSDSHLLPDTLPTALRGPVTLQLKWYSQVKCTN